MKLNIVLYQPEIPENTANIMRTCAAANFKLHLIEPLGFALSSSKFKRSSANNLDNVNYERYINWQDFLSKNDGELFYMTRYGKISPSQVDYTKIDKDIYLVFGRESTGIPYELLAENLDHCFRLPMNSNVRALNVSNCVAICAYEVLRQLDYPGLSKVEPENFKGENFLDNFKK
ncbi:MAG: tRNA (cytidine(34)-2'-O)-methyltransferase [Acholeplasmatales bacterium]|nr:tRNA (cytidine(34)-2'-O)-methyltransferase [Acholeplasmatales bacterium]